MAEDTGGRAFFDSNSFGQVFDRVVADTSAYYVLGFSSTNPARDGRFRRIKVRLKRTRPEARIPIRLLRAARFRALDARTTRSSSCRISCCPICRPPIWAAYVSTGVFPPRPTTATTCRCRSWFPAIRCRSTKTDTEGQGDARRARRRARRAEAAGRPHPRHREARARSRRRFEAEDRPVRDRPRDAAGHDTT